MTPSLYLFRDDGLNNPRHLSTRRPEPHPHPKVFAFAMPPTAQTLLVSEHFVRQLIDRDLAHGEVIELRAHARIEGGE